MQRSWLRRWRILISVVLPAFNEEPFLADTVDELVDGLRGRARPFELLIVENGSADGTRAVADKLSARYDEVRSLSTPEADYGAALRHGFVNANGDTVVNFDVDYFDLAFLDRALDLLAGDQCVMVVAAKRGEGATDTRAWSRRLVTAVFSTILHVGFGLNVVDTHGMKAMNRAALAPLVNASRSSTDLYDTELVIRVERSGFKVAAVPVTVAERRASRTSVIRRIPRSMNGLRRLWLQLRRERGNTG
jgi:glycosyltransferase involved in cell wall biosynthesis